MTLRHHFRRTAVSGGLIVSLLLSGCGGSSNPSSDDQSDSSAPLAKLLPENVRAEGKIVAGGLMDVPPVDFYDSQKNPTGVNPELAHLMEKQLGIEIEFRKLAFSGLQPALQSGKIDIIWDSMNDTVEREKVLDFVDYLNAGYTLLVPGNNPKHVKTLSDLCGGVMATIRGAVQIDSVKAQSKKCQSSGKKPIDLKLYESTSDARLQVRNGRVDAFIGNAPALLYLAATAGGGSTFESVVLKDAGTSYYGIGFKQDDTKLRKAFTAALNKVINDGSYAKVLQKYSLGELAVDQAKTNAASK